jgi:hypothetical protein
MAGRMIRLGDKTSHGGTVIESSLHSDIGGKRMAPIGDKTSCPARGPNPIFKCVMYGELIGRTDFCPNCAPAVREVDLSSGWELP